VAGILATFLCVAGNLRYMLLLSMLLAVAVAAAAGGSSENAFRFSSLCAFDACGWLWRIKVIVQRIGQWTLLDYWRCHRVLGA